MCGPHIHIIRDYKRTSPRVNFGLALLLYVCVAHTHEPNPNSKGRLDPLLQSWCLFNKYTLWLMSSMAICRVGPLHNPWDNINYNNQTLNKGQSCLINYGPVKYAESKILRAFSIIPLCFFSLLSDIPYVILCFWLTFMT